MNTVIITFRSEFILDRAITNHVNHLQSKQQELIYTKLRSDIAQLFSKTVSALVILNYVSSQGGYVSHMGKMGNVQKTSREKTTSETLA